MIFFANKKNGEIFSPSFTCIFRCRFYAKGNNNRSTFSLYIFSRVATTVSTLTEFFFFNFPLA